MMLSQWTTHSQTDSVVMYDAVSVDHTQSSQRTTHSQTDSVVSLMYDVVSVDHTQSDGQLRTSTVYSTACCPDTQLHSHCYPLNLSVISIIFYFLHSSASLMSTLSRTLTSSWPHLSCDVGLEEGEYK